MNYWQNLSKFLYDLAKITFAGLVIGSIVAPKGAKPSNIILGGYFNSVARRGCFLARSVEKREITDVINVGESLDIVFCWGNNRAAWVGFRLLRR